jgi:hypothetical protein
MPEIFVRPPERTCDHGPHRCAGTRNGAEHAGDRVADTLADQLLVGVVARTGHVVGNQRGQQAVDGTEDGQDEGRFQHHQRRVRAEARQHELRQAGRDVAQHRRARNEEADHRTDQQRRERARDVGGEFLRPGEDDEQRHRGNADGDQIRVHHGAGDGGEGRDRAAAVRLVPEQAGELKRNDDDADAAHEAGDHRIGHQFHILAELQHAEADLQDTGEYDGREDQRRVAAKRRIKAGEDDDHRAGRSGDLRAGAAEEGGEEANENCAPETGNRAGA